MKNAFDNLWLVTNTLSEVHNFLVVLQELCSYGPTTTQQQAHNRASCCLTVRFTSNKMGWEERTRFSA